ncbi:LLM class flavin-dependent oxidoreductase [Bradyrhizobium sp. LHD-71]|uniref:LLM class flavin-dependent oxidoreductase n=1 Tax=Bradyrhizobium sp. LHD-71 TaxID=3072141 RepID=UPI00280DE5E1|nr:LLM class flavin-dependent oxidoreductase [Bradyrhizobium sp. LHD-71]MDQ8728026.1 LLM class flavin-dependent oxidoreductase [Bradyrhizobium sp. LHD-71]
MNRQMKLIGFLQAQNCSNYPASWRHPASKPNWFSREYYEEIGRTLERGKFHLAFFDDRLAIPDRFGEDFTETVRHGIRAAKLDPLAVAMAMGLATRHLGIGFTYSTTYYEPFHVARVFATVDLLLNGRVAWNVVTSLNDSEAANFGASEHLAHDLRYDRADEFMEVVLGHWNTWEDDAIVFDREKGLFADPDKVHRLDHRGKFFTSRGPFTVPRSAQGHPVIIQAGQSGRGKQFASRWGELIFVIYPNLEIATRQYADMKRALGDRAPQVAIAPAIYPVVAETQAEAEDKFAAIDRLASPIDSLTLLSEVLNFDFATKPMDEPFSADELRSIGGLQAVRDRVVQLSGKANPTVQDFVEFSGRGRLKELPTFVGSTKSVADKLEEWFTGGACDGFVVAATHVPGTYDDFVQLVVPELQRRGLFRREYQGETLRESLGLPRPQWRSEGRARHQA